MLAHVKRFYFEHVVSFFGGFGVKLIAQVSDIISDLMAYLLVIHTLPEVASQVFHGIKVGDWAWYVFLSTLVSSLLSIACDLFEYVKERRAKQHRDRARNRTELERRSREGQIATHRTRVVTAFIHLPLLVTEDGFSMAFSLLMILQYDQSFTSFFFLNLLMSAVIFLVMLVCRAALFAESVARIQQLRSVDAGSEGAMQTGGDEELALLPVEGGEPGGKEDEENMENLPAGVRVLKSSAWFGEAVVNETVDCLQDGVSSWQILKDPRLRSEALLFLPAGAWAAGTFGVCLYSFLGTVATQIAVHRRREILKILSGPQGWMLKAFLYPLIFPAAVVAGALDPERTWQHWRSGGARVEAVDQYEEDEEGGGGQAEGGEEEDWALEEKEAFVGNWAEVLFIVEDVTSMGFNAAVAFSTIKGLYSLQAANFFCTLSSFVVRLVIVESKRRKMALQALIKAKREIVVSVENRAFVVEQLQRGDLAELKKMQVRLQMAEDVQGFSQEFVAGRMPGLTDLQVSRPEFERAVAGEENKELHGAICRMLEQGQMLALQSLNVSGCSFGDGGASALLEIIRGGALPELSSLRAQNCDVGARGAEAFGSACRDGVLSGVRLLDVRKNDFGGELGRDEVGGSFLLGQMSGTLEAVVHPSNPQSAALKGRVVLVDGWGKNKRDELWELVGTAVEGLERPGGSGLSVFLGLCDRFRPWFAPTFLGSLPSKTKALFLRGAEVSGKGWEALAGRVGALLSLESVDISKANLFGDIDALKSLLASLPASCKKIEIEGLKSAAPLTFVKSLEVVNLKGAELPGESEWRVLSDKLSELSLLQSVDVSESSLLEDLPSLEKLLAVLPGSCEKVGLEGLKAIDLSKESGWTSDATLKALRNLPKSLETVNLKGAAVSAEGWDSLIKSFSELSLLQSVDVSESSLLSNDADDLRRFLTALPVSCKTVRLKGLRTADLSAGADLSAQGRTTAISNFPTSVNSLKLKGAQLTSEGWATLAEKLSSLNMPFSGLNFVDLSESNLLGDISALRKFLNALPNSCKTVGKHDQIVLSGITSLDLSGNTEWQANEKEVVITNLPSTLETFNFSQIHQDRLFQQKATSSFWKSLEKSLYRLEHLKEFDFSYCTAGESQITHAFMGLPRCLEKLNVQGTSIVLDPRKPNRPKAGSQHDETWGSFGSSVRGMKQLKELILSSCSLNDKKVERVFNKLPDSLEKLDLENNRDILPGGWSVLGNRMSELKVLKELNLRRCNLNMERLAPMIPTLPVGLETLILAGNSEIVPDGWKTLADRLPMFVGMKVLDLEGCGLDDVSAIRLFPSLPSTLETLGLSRNKAIEARGWAALGTRVKSLEQLKRLSLSSCELTDSRVKELFQFLPAGLEEINISANHNLSDGVKAELKEKPSLKVIEKG